MAYVFSTLIFVLGLVTGLSVIPQLLRMQKIKQDSATAAGTVFLNDRPNLNDSTMTGLMSSMLGKVSYVQVSYQTPDQKERTIEIVESTNFQIRRYKSGDSVVVVYDKSLPSLAYVKKEWDSALRDLWMAGGEILVAVVIWNVSSALNLPM